MMRFVIVAVLLLRALPAFALAFHAEIPISPAELGPSRYATDPKIATNGAMYVAAWTDYRMSPGATWAARVRPDGTLLDRVGIRIAPDSQIGAVVWSGRAFLIAYLEQGMVKVRALTPEGVLGAPIDLFGNYVLRNVYQMRMATNGANVLLVTSDATAAILDLDGNELRQLSFPWLWARAIGVAAAGSSYMVAAAMHDGDLRTLAVDTNGDFGESHKLMDSVYSVDVSSDGERFLVAWARGNLYAQFVARDGTPAAPAIALTALEQVYSYSHQVSRLVRRAGEWVLLYRAFGGAPSDTLRIGPAGETRGPLLTTFDGLVADIAPTDGEGGIVGFEANVIAAAFFDGSSPAAVKNRTPVSLAGKWQSQVKLAPIAGGFVSAWRVEAVVPELWLSRGPGSTPVRVVAAEARLIDVVVESGAVWVVWATPEGLYVRRFTPALQPIDAEPVVLREAQYANELDYAAAGGGGSVVVVQNQLVGGYSQDPIEPHIEAHVLRPTPGGIDAMAFEVGSAEGLDRLPAIAWDGSAFVIAWANATGYVMSRGGIATNDRATPYKPDDRILAMRMSAAGARLDPSPIRIAVVRHLEALQLATGPGGPVVAWHTYVTPNLESRRHTYAARVAADAAVADLGGDDTYFGAFTAHENGFLLTRAAVRGSTTLQPEVVAVDAGLAVTGAVQLAPMTVNQILGGVNPYDADLVGGTLSYARIAGGSYGNVQRLFVRRIAETQRRRAVR